MTRNPAAPNPPNPSAPRPLPHHRLLAYGVALQLLDAVKRADIRDRELRHHALNAAKSACLNIAEAAGRASRADKGRVLAIARGETVEAIAAVEIAAVAGDAAEASAAECAAIGDRLVALLTGFIRR